MAKAKEGVNRSQAIRDAEKEMPNAMAKEIVEYLKGKGITVSDQLVYQVRKMDKKKKPGRKLEKMTRSRAASAPGIHLGVAASIALVRTTAEKVGGLASLKEIVDALA